VPRLFLGLADVHRDLVGDDVTVEVRLVPFGRVAEVAELLGQLLGVLGAAARHPSVSALDDPSAGPLHAATHLVARRVPDEAWVRHDPDRRRRLQRTERRHLRSGVERDRVVVEMLAVKGDLTLSPQSPQDVQALFPDRSGLRVIETEGGKLAAHALLGIALAGPEERAAA